MKEKVKQQPFRSSYDNLIRYNGLNSMFRPVPNDAIYFLVNKNSIEDFFSMMKYSLYATKNEKLISDLNEAFVENNPCFGNSITKFLEKIPLEISTISPGIGDLGTHLTPRVIPTYS